MHIDLFVHASKETCYDLGLESGLTGEALCKFVYAGNEFKITLDVDADTGVAKPIKLDGKLIQDL